MSVPSTSLPTGDPGADSAPAAAWTWVDALAAPVVCDLAAFAVLAVDGSDAAGFLQGQLSSDVLALSADSCEYTSYNSPAGRTLANMLVWRAGPNAADGFRALVAADSAAFIRHRLAMFVLRSKVSVTDASPQLACFGAGGPRVRDALKAALGAPPAPFSVAHHGGLTVLGVHGPRCIVVAPKTQREAVFARLAAHLHPTEAAVWQWLTLRSGVAVITEATRDKFVPQMLNWDLLGGVNFQKGCYTGQEIIARTQYLGRLKERLFAFASREAPVRPGERLFSAVFGGQPCGTVINAATSPAGGCELLAVVQIAAAQNGGVRLGAPDGPLLAPLALPYAIPAPAASRNPAL